RVEDRLLRVRDEFDRLADLPDIALHHRTIGTVLDIGREAVFSLLELHVLRNVDDNRAGAAMRRDIEGFMHDANEFRRGLHQPVMLGAVARDTDRIGFLEGIRTDEMGRDLPRQADQRDRIHQCVRETGNSIGGTGAGSDEHNARLARRTRIALGRVNRALLMANENVANLVLLEKRVIDRQDSAARIAENRVHALIDQRLDDDFCACQFLSSHWSRPGPSSPGNPPDAKTTRRHRAEAPFPGSLTRIAAEIARNLTAPYGRVNPNSSTNEKILSLNLSEYCSKNVFHAIICVRNQVSCLFA